MLHVQNRYSEHPELGRSEAGIYIQAFSRGFLPDLPKSTAIPPGKSSFVALHNKKVLKRSPISIAQSHFNHANSLRL